jgi:peptidoglycan-N-acetylmuramic acid deacetylase
MRHRVRNAFVGLVLAAGMAGCAAVGPASISSGGPPLDGQTTSQPSAGQPGTGQSPDQAPQPAADTRSPVQKARWVIKTHYGPITSDDPAVKGQKVALLTFDDGPSPEYTPRILDILKEQGIQAIFFVNAPAKAHPDLIRRMVAEGHIVGTHTMTHPLLTDLSEAQQRQEIGEIADIVTEITGKRPYYFRAPFGAYNETTLAILQDLQMQLLNWDHGSGDWMDVRDGYKDPAIVINDVLSEVPRNSQMTPLHPGSVILFHDTLKQTAEALPAIIAGLKAKGYAFVLPVEGQ